MFNEASDIWHVLRQLMGLYFFMQTCRSTAQLKTVEHDIENAALAPVKVFWTVEIDW